MGSVSQTSNTLRFGCVEAAAAVGFKMMVLVQGINGGSAGAWILYNDTIEKRQSQCVTNSANQWE
jgi:hypothetical protein